ncbi:MAG: phosphatidylserine decarboxylase family protein [Clostridia bacterium]|nr:phosphatidylserine decarboxylase family protein [Clostridia bacterium]
MKQQQYVIAKEGFPYIVLLAVITALVFIFSPWIAIAPGLLTIFVTYFFRNPHRVIPQDTSLLVSPADGVVMEVTEIDEDRFIKDKAKRVTIFLSVFNVHLNRTPIEGRVAYREYRPGRMVPAYKSHAADVNETNYVGIENDKLKVLVSQITGLIARRIVCWVETGEKVKRGDLFGLIKFGSCTEIMVPLNVEILVKKGDKVKGGETIIGRLSDEL